MTTYVYNATTGDLTSQIGATGTADENVTTLRYDRFGNVVAIVNPVGNVTAPPMTGSSA